MYLKTVYYHFYLKDKMALMIVDVENPLHIKKGMRNILRHTLIKIAFIISL